MAGQDAPGAGRAAESPGMEGTITTIEAHELPAFLKKRWVITANDNALTFSVVDSGRTFTVLKQDAADVITFPPVGIPRLEVTEQGHAHALSMQGSERDWLRSWVPRRTMAQRLRYVAGVVAAFFVVYVFWLYVHR